MSKDGNPMNKYKRKLKKAIGCACGWFWFGSAFLIAGIVLLVYFVKFWGDGNETHKSNLSYTGAACVGIGLLFLSISIVICVILRCIYSRQNATKSGGKAFTPPKYAPGEAPYPQQAPLEPQQPPAEASAPPPDSKVNLDEIKIEDGGKY